MMPMFRLLLFCSLLGARSALGFVVDDDGNGVPEKWDLVTLPGFVHTNVVNRTTKAIRYYLAADAYSSTNTAAELNAVRACLAQWQAVPGTSVKFEEGGLLAPGVYLDLSDHTNSVSWAKTNTTVGFANIISALGVTFVSYIGDSIEEADIVFNGVEFRWFTDFNASPGSGPPHYSFTEGVALHEIGHFVGVLHSPVGGASMFYGGLNGVVNPQAALSGDDISAVRSLYSQPGALSTLGTLKGTVVKNGLPVIGATVIVEAIPSGNAVAGTLTVTNGAYEFTAIPPGSYNLRVTPLDPGTGSPYLLLRDHFWFPDSNPFYSQVDTSFLPTANSNIAVSAGATNTLNFHVMAGDPPFRITSIRAPTTNSLQYFIGNSPLSVNAGQSNLTIGVYSPDFSPGDGSVLAITGDGLSVGSTTYTSAPFGGSPPQNLLSVTLNVASNATPGLRSFVVARGTNIANANGFLDILPPAPDFNFDGLDDRFQRQHFALFTAPEAAPSADPDGDTFPNLAESVAGTNPTNSLSLLRITSTTQNVSGTTITWESVAGKKYQIVSRADLTGSPWQTNTPLVTATGGTAQFTDSAPGPMRFYRVQVLP
jgi:hypothetical protein